MGYYGDRVSELLEENKSLRRRLDRQVILNQEMKFALANTQEMLEAVRARFIKVRDAQISIQEYLDSLK